jgi:CRISPR-associated endonuclease Csn1
MQSAQGGLVDPESKHHVAIYRTPDGGFRSRIVSLWEAAERLSARAPIVEKEIEGGSLVMSLSKGDTVRLDDPRAPYWIVKKIKSNGQITLAPHTVARPTDQELFSPALRGFMKLNPRKVSVDPIGRVRPAND